MAHIHTDKRIVFLGTPDFAVASLEKLIQEKYNVVAVVTAQDKPSGRGRNLNMSDVKECAVRHNIPVLQPISLKNQDFIEELRKLHADIQVVVAFRMLPEIVWKMPALGTINVHGSLLPKYRGAAPINWAIINGESETGVTTFLLRHQIDTGDILMQRKVTILEKDNFGTMYEKLKNEGAELLHITLQKYFSGETALISQENTESTHAPKIFKEMCHIDFNKSAEDLHNFIRGLAPKPGAFTHIEGKVFKIYESVFINQKHDYELGRIISDGKTFLRFACYDSLLDVKKVQMEGKKAMNIEDFLRGYQLDITF